MLALGPLTFTYPLALLGFVFFAVIWWFLRLKPPTPIRIAFPPVRLLARLVQNEESPAKTPWWLLLLRLALVSVVILAIAHPLVDARSPLANSGPVYVVIDDDWSAAKDWAKRKSTMMHLADQAEREQRPMVVVTTSLVPSITRIKPPSVLTPDEARNFFEALQPKPWATDRTAAITRLTELDDQENRQQGSVFWLSNGLDDKNDTDIIPFIAALKKLGSVGVISNQSNRLPIVIQGGVYEKGVLKIKLRRTSAQGGFALYIRAIAESGQNLVRKAALFKTGALEAEAQLRLPAEQFNSLSRVEVEGANHAGAVLLFDERWRRRPIGLVTMSSGNPVQPLLSELHYLSRALEPFTEIRKGSVDELLKRQLALVALTDPGPLTVKDRNALAAWMSKGGVLIRFSGPNLSQDGVNNKDQLLPVKLRSGDRAIGGAMSWRKPATLAPFDKASPFSGLQIAKDVVIRRQVLASPSLDLADKTWARLSDGTPLVTADKRGAGWSILFHTSANAEWSNLVHSGMFVEMLQRIVDLSQGVAESSDGPPLAPIDILDGFGVLIQAGSNAQSIAPKAFDGARVSADHPPGIYGSNGVRRVLNLSTELGVLNPISNLPGNVDQLSYQDKSEQDLRPWLFMVALVLFIIDTITSLSLRGLLLSKKAIGSLALGAFFALGFVDDAKADDDFARANSLETRLAYVITGDKRVDETSRLGLMGLTGILKSRTAAELGIPQAIDPGVDDLSFFPLLYWPIVEGYQLPNDLTPERVSHYLQSGGTILFDTRDGAGRTASIALRELADGLKLPALVPVPQGHVLSRSFYLLDDFPGRWTGGGIWIEKAGERVNDGVASVISGGHDWAAAWAVDDMGRPLYPVVPGGERQREMAYRFGVNLVMYTLTGNYKADQVHLPAILQRIGQ